MKTTTTFNFKLRLTFVILIYFQIGNLSAQPDAPINPAPLDGGLSLLIAAGTFYGARQLKRHYNSKNDNEV